MSLEAPERKRLVWLGASALALVLGVAAAFVVVLYRDRSSGDLSGSSSPVQVRALLSEHSQFFGDTLVARIEAAADTERVERGSIQIAPRFGRYRVADSPTLERRTVGGVEYTVWTARLRCLAEDCLPEEAEMRVEFPPAK